MSETVQTNDQEVFDTFVAHFNSPEVQKRMAQVVANQVTAAMDGIRDIQSHSIDGMVSGLVEWFRQNWRFMLVAGIGGVGMLWLGHRYFVYRWPDRDVGQRRSIAEGVASTAQSLRAAADALVAMGYRATEAKKIVRALRDNVQYADAGSPQNALSDSIFNSESR